MNIFLRAKHWQLFLLTFGLPFVFQILVMSKMFSGISTGNPPDPSFILDYLKFFPLLMILLLGVLFGWMWSIGMGLRYKLPSGVSLNTTLFKVTLLFPVIYILILSILVTRMISDVTSETPDLGLIPFFALIVPLHFFCMFCMFYNMYFVAKTFKAVELQRAVTFSDFGGEFVLIWFYFIGVWILQPKINKMADEPSRNI